MAFRWNKRESFASSLLLPLVQKNRGRFQSITRHIKKKSLIFLRIFAVIPFALYVQVEECLRKCYKALWGIPVGAVIKYINDPSIEATVVDDGHISYKGVTTSTSALAKELLESEYPVQGTAYFTYEDEKLTDRRDRMEKE